MESGDGRDGQCLGARGGSCRGGGYALRILSAMKIALTTDLSYDLMI